LVKHIVPVFVW